MRKLFCFWLVMSLLPSFVLASEEDVRFIYSGFDFIVPSGAVVFGAQGGSDNFTFFRFGEQKGKYYLSFTDITSESPGYGCEAKVFYSHLAGVSGASTCSKSEIDSFKKVFVGDSEVGEWLGKELAAYYFYGAEKSHMFIFSKNRIIKIDTDFLSKSDLKHIIKYYL